MLTNAKPEEIRYIKSLCLEKKRLSGAKPPQPPETYRGLGGRSTRRCDDFTAFLQNTRNFWA